MDKGVISGQSAYLHANEKRNFNEFSDAAT